MYISLLIIPCIIYYVTNKETLINIVICHSCYSIIHKLKKNFPSSVPQVHKKCWKIIQNENTINICDLFPCVIFKREILTDVYRADVTFLIPIEEMDFFLFFSIIILCCIIAYCVISVSKGSNK